MILLLVFVFVNIILCAECQPPSRSVSIAQLEVGARWEVVLLFCWTTGDLQHGPKSNLSPLVTSNGLPVAGYETSTTTTTR
uniref:Putative secreted peptide n=1 Tax=Anopheles braziliensis TaxID=58242 RepID=A0A2M3ZW53_9DIPT